MSPHVSVITPLFNSREFLRPMLESLAMQDSDGLEIEHIVVDGGSSDGSVELVREHGVKRLILVQEPDDGPADAINKGFALASGDKLAWLNGDDLYAPGALRRACAELDRNPGAALCFGHCPIIDGDGAEIRKPITFFKEMWYPFSFLPVLQTLNFVSQPATVFRRSAVERAGPLRTDMVAAWDYEFILRLWKEGGGVRLPRPSMACFRWTPTSISGSSFETQFAEEWRAAAESAGRYSPQALSHRMVSRMIVWIYAYMARRREARKICE